MKILKRSYSSLETICPNILPNGTDKKFSIETMSLLQHCLLPNE